MAGENEWSQAVVYFRETCWLGRVPFERLQDRSGKLLAVV